MPKFYERRRKKTKGVTLYKSPKPRENRSSEELNAYRKLGLVFVVVIVFALFIYFWGISTVNFISSFWLRLSPEQTSSTGGKDILIFPPRIDSLPNAVNSQKSLKIAGWAPAGTDIQIYINEELIDKTLADASGRFEITNLSLKAGKNSIYAIAVGHRDVKSPPSNKQIVTYDKTKPNLRVDEPSENLKITKAEDRWLTVSGKTEINARVYINKNQVIVDLQGNFKYQYPLNMGENSLKIKALDEAGNETIVERSITFESTHTPSATPAE